MLNPIFYCKLLVILLSYGSVTWCLTLSVSNSTDIKAALPRAIDPSTPVRYYSDVELNLIWQACIDLSNWVSGNDAVLFVGNSGGYLAYCFDHPRMKPIPLSKAKRYWRIPSERRARDPEGYGKPPSPRWKIYRKYYKDYLKEIFHTKTVSRIVLVDHSSTGASVDATRTILLDILCEAYDQVGISEKEFGREWFPHNKFALYNYIDRRLQEPNGGFRVTNPEFVPILRRFTAGQPHEVDHLLADEGYHDRVQAEYWPARWDRTTTEIWEEDGGKPQAQRMRQQIKEYVRSRNNGRLLSPGALNRN